MYVCITLAKVRIQQGAANGIHHLECSGESPTPLVRRYDEFPTLLRSRRPAEGEPRPLGEKLGWVAQGAITDPPSTIERETILLWDLPAACWLHLPLTDELR